MRNALPKLAVLLSLSGLLIASPALGQDLALASVSAVAVDVDDSDVLLEQNADLVLPIASITKLMTGLVVLESGADLDEWLTIEDWDRKTAKNAYSRIRLGSSARRRDLLRIALMSSENRAAYNLALHHPGGFDTFVAAMNAKARSLKMQDTHFTDPTGLDVTNKSSATDLARMVLAAYEQPLLREYSTTRQFSVSFKQPRYQLGYGNTNPLTGSSRWDVDLTKTGYLTEAGRCLVMVTEMDGRRVGVVLLNSLGTRSPLGDAGRIRRYLEAGTQGKVAKAALDHRARVMQNLGLSAQ
jgi:D-alanyl-D-alanine endopeptidase (penicillin-binding protein 7)